MYLVPVGAEGGELLFCNLQIRIVKNTRFVEIIQSTVLRDTLQRQ